MFPEVVEHVDDTEVLGVGDEFRDHDAARRVGVVVQQFSRVRRLVGVHLLEDGLGVSLVQFPQNVHPVVAIHFGHDGRGLARGQILDQVGPLRV